MVQDRAKFQITKYSKLFYSVLWKNFSNKIVFKIRKDNNV